MREAPPKEFVDRLTARIEEDALPLQSAEIVKAFRDGWATVSGVHDPDTGTLIIETHVVTVGDWARFVIVVHSAGMLLELLPHVIGSNQRPIGARGLFALGVDERSPPVPQSAEFDELECRHDRGCLGDRILEWSVWCVAFRNRE